MPEPAIDQAAVDAVLTASRALVAMATMSLGAAAEDTTIAQYRALVVLASRGPQRMVDLAAALGVTPSTAGRMCDRLVRKGLIRRHRDRADWRAVQVSITAAGKQVVDHATEDLCDRIWGNRPEWARPAAGGILLGLLLLALPQMYGVGYPVLYKAVGGSYALWFLIILAAGKIIACSLTIGIGGSGGVFAPSLFIGATSGMAFGEIARHLIGPAAGQPALYAVVAMGAVFASAARAPLTSVASVVEMTGDFTLTLPVMLAVAIATATSRGLSYGTIYTTKLLRRGTDIDRDPSADPFEDLTAADAMRPFPAPLSAMPQPLKPRWPTPTLASFWCPATASTCSHQHNTIHNPHTRPASPPASSTGTRSPANGTARTAAPTYSGLSAGLGDTRARTCGRMAGPRSRSG
jgi:DNA-binding MarR family transcriptional regulator